MKLIGFLISFLGLIVLKCSCMHYEEPINLDSWERLFDEDCIDGTLSVMEDGSPLFRAFSVDTPLTIKENTTDEFDGKSTLSLINELATFHNIKYQYVLIDEEGPPHRKRFVVSLILGEEKYDAEGNSIKKAKQAAAKMALISTSYEHPPEKPKKDDLPKPNDTPAEKLHRFVGKNSDYVVKYSYMEQSKPSPNYYHAGMYSKANNVHKVTVRIGDEQFEGEGPTRGSAKQAAANNALKQLQNNEGFCMFDDSVKGLFARLFNHDSNEQSPISLVHEFASKSKLKTSFDLVSEEGPAHIKKYVYKCSVGDSFETLGEGSSKKIAKAEAAERMIQILKSNVPGNAINCGKMFSKKGKSKRKRKNILKSVKDSYYNEINPEHSIPDDVHPISKLYQIQQKKHDVEPVFRLVEERNSMFVMEVTVGDMSFAASGSNKKQAKRKAAEGMLNKMGYSSSSDDDRFSSFDFKIKEFFGDDEGSSKVKLAPGMNIDAEPFSKIDSNKATRQNNLKPSHPEGSDKKTHKSNVGKKNKSGPTTDKNTSDNSPKKQLKSLAQQLGIRFQFSDFPKNSRGGFVSLVSLSTNPPKLCYGTSSTIDSSQENAALSALATLYKIQLNSISQILKESSFKQDTFKIKDIRLIEDKIIIEPLEKTKNH